MYGTFECHLSTGPSIRVYKVFTGLHDHDKKLVQLYDCLRNLVCRWSSEVAVHTLTRRLGGPAAHQLELIESHARTDEDDLLHRTRLTIQSVQGTQN